MLSGFQFCYFAFFLQGDADSNSGTAYLPAILGVIVIVAIMLFFSTRRTRDDKQQDVGSGWAKAFSSLNPDLDPSASSTPEDGPAATEATAKDNRDYLTYRYENTKEDLRRKDEDTQQFARNGYRIISEHIEQGHIKGQEQCCWALVCLPGIFLAGRTPGAIVVTYGREAIGSDSKTKEPIAESTKRCPFCAEYIQAEAKKCRFCGEFLTSP